MSATRAAVPVLLMALAGMAAAGPEKDSPDAPYASGPDPVTAALQRCQDIEHGQPSEARELARDLLARAEVLDDPVRHARALACLGWSEAQLGMASARTTTDRLAELLPSIEAPEVRAAMMRRVAGLQQQTNRGAESIETLMDALDLVEREGLDDERTSLLINLAIAHSEARNHEVAIGHYETALSALSADDGRRMPILYNLGLTLRGADRNEDARDVFGQLVEPLSAPGLEIRLASLLSVLGSIELELGNLDAAERFLARSDALHDDLDNPGEHAALLIEWSELARRRGDIDAAIAHAREALAEAERAEFTPSIRGALRNLATVLAAAGRFEEAMDIQGRYVTVSDDFWRAQMESRLEDAEARYGNERQARELAELRQASQEQDFILRRERLRQQLLLGLGIAALSIAVAAFIWQRRNTRRLRRLSRTDPLTGLANRRQASEWLDRLEPGEPGRWSVLWLLDLDHFKRINDSHGHDAGDRALQDVAALLERLAERHGLYRPARWGGEEFLLFGRIGSPRQAMNIAEDLRAAITGLRPRDRMNDAIELTASIGFSPLTGLHRPSGQADWEPAMLAADQLLYRAKQRGRNCWMGLWPDRVDARIAAHDIEAAIREGRGRLLDDRDEDRTAAPGTT